MTTLQITFDDIDASVVVPRPAGARKRAATRFAFNVLPVLMTASLLFWSVAGFAALHLAY